MKSLAELAELREKMKPSVKLRQDNSNSTRVVVALGTCGIAAGARPVLNAFVEEVTKRELDGIMVTASGCIGMCKNEPVVEVCVPGKEKVTYINVTPDKVAKIVEEHLVNGQAVTEYIG